MAGMPRHGTMMQALMSGVAATVLAGCAAPPLVPNQPDDPESVARGKAAAERLGCGACHALPGIAWPKGRVGPPLDGFATRALIAGRLPNRPEILSRFVRNAPALVPGTAMPAIAMSDRDAVDIAAYLQDTGDE